MNRRPLGPELTVRTPGNRCCAAARMARPTGASLRFAELKAAADLWPAQKKPPEGGFVVGCGGRI